MPLPESLRIRDLAAALLPGLLSGTLVIIFSVSFAALIFSGPLSGHIVQGISLAISTAVVVGLGITFFSRCQPVVAFVDEDTAPVFALLVSLVVASLPASATEPQVLATAVAAIVATAVLTGVGLALLGLFRFGVFVQYLPHSVLGGYFAAVGWLLVAGGLKVVADADLVAGLDVTALAGNDQLVRWLPAVVLAMWLLVMRGRMPTTILLPASLVAGVAAWYGVLFATGYSPADAMAAGFLLGPFAESNGSFLVPLGGVDLGQVNWSAIAGNAGSAASIFLVAVLSLILCLSGLGLLTHTDLDVNRELKVSGLTNIASGLGGGMVGLPSYSLSALAVDGGARNNAWVGIITVAVVTGVYLFAMPAVAFIPRFVLGGILLYLGLSLMFEWLVRGRQKFAPLEYLIIPVILVVAIYAGFVQGVLIGLIAAIILFAVKYSRTRVIRFTATGSQIASNVDRDADAQQLVSDNGEQIFIMGLQGYLFFGTAGQIYTRLLEHVARARARQLRYVVIDFAQVTGLDASAAIVFRKILQFAESHDICVVIAGLPTALRKRLQEGGFARDDLEHLLFMPDIDRSLEWCESRMLEGQEGTPPAIGCFEQMGAYLSDDEIGTLMGYLERREIDAGYVLAEQGARTDELYFMETCGASAYITDATGKSHRVRRTTRGTVFGELGFYLQIPRTAQVQADEPGTVYVLDRAALARMEEDDPAVAAGLHRYMAVLISERLMFTTRTLNAVMI